MKLIAVDTETTGLHVDDGAEVKVVSVCDGMKVRAFFLEEMDTREVQQLVGWLAQQRIVMHNAKFDCHMLRTLGVELVEQVEWDTMIAVRVLQPMQSAALDVQARALWGEEAVKWNDAMSEWLSEKRKKGDSKWKAPRELLELYALEDVELTWKLYHHQLRLLEHGETLLQSRLLQREFELMKTLYKMEQRGVGFDVERAKKATRRLQRRIAELVKTIPFRPTLPGARKFYFGEEGMIPVEFTEKGQPSMNERVREVLKQQGASHIEEYDEYERLKHYVSMWYDGWTRLAGADGRLRTTFTQIKVVSMRLSSERLQLQSIPHDYRLSALPAGVPKPRQLIVPAKGKRLYELDVSQAEIRIATDVSRCVGMRHIIESGKDVHDATCERLFGYGPKDSKFKQYRNIAKRLNFATVYGIGARGFVEQMRVHTGMEITESQAREFLGLHRREFPEFVRASVVVERKARARQHVRLATGMRRWFAEWEQESMHKAFNQVIQGGVAECMKDWMCEIERDWSGMLLLQIHDSLVVEIPQEQSETTARYMADQGVRWFERYFSIPFVIAVKEWGK